MITLPLVTFFSSRGIDLFTIEVSAHLHAGYSLVLSDNLPNISPGTTCEEIPLHSFSVERRARYVKIISKTFHGIGPGLKYVRVNHRAN